MRIGMTGQMVGGSNDGQQVEYITRLAGGNFGNGQITTDAFFGGAYADADYKRFFKCIKISLSTADISNGGNTHVTETNGNGIPSYRLFTYNSTWLWDAVNGARSTSPTIAANERYDINLDITAVGDLVTTNPCWYYCSYNARVTCEKLSWDNSWYRGACYLGNSRGGTSASPLNMPPVYAHIYGNSTGNFYGMKMWNWDKSVLEHDLVPWCDKDGVPCIKNLVTGVKSYAARPDLYWALPTT